MEYLHGGDVYTYEGMIDFSANINPFGPSKAVLRAARAAMLRMGSYPDPQCRQLRKLLAGELNVPGENLIFGNGAADLIFSAVLAEKPRRAVVSVPAFSEYEQALKTVDCDISFYYCREENGFVMQEDFMELLTEDVDMVFLCSPNNPTGAIIPKILLRKIMIRCEILKIRLVIDQCFLDFVENDGEELFLTFGDALGEATVKYPSLLLIRAFTKMHAMPGLRLGYGMTHDLDLIRRMEAVRQPWSVSVAAQEAGAAAVKDKKRVETTRDFIVRERRWMERQFRKMGITYYPTRANFILFESDLNLSEEMRKRGILIRDCSNYRGLRRGFYRVAIRRRGDNQRLMDALEDICRGAWKENQTEQDGEAPGSDAETF